MPKGVYLRTEEHRKNIGKATRKTQFKSGGIPWNKGITWKRKNPTKPFSKEWLAKIPKFPKGHIPWNKGIIGKKSHAWMGGKLGLTERIRTSDRYKKWRSDVFYRDGWTCQTCGLRGHGRDIEAHHIKSMKELLEKTNIAGLDIDDRYLLAMEIPEIFDVSNGVTLCKACHILTYKQGEIKCLKN